jgi:TonB-linked SusC/RagA family outer membrane protein
MRSRKGFTISFLSLTILLFITNYAFSQSKSDSIKDHAITKKDTSSSISSIYDGIWHVHLTFNTVKANDVIGFVTPLNAEKITKYDHTIWLNNVYSGRTLGLLGTQPIRGLGRGIGVTEISGNPYSGHPVIIVDGLPRNPDNIRLSNVKSITVLRDVNSAMLYGSEAINGAILINTKRGAPHKNVTDVTVNYGISQPKEFPSYLNSAEYMTYYNEALKNDGLSSKYNKSTIQDYRSGNKYRYPSVDYYSNKYLKPVKNYFDINAQLNGGNNVAQYYSNFGWNSSGSLIDFGRGKKGRDNRFNVRGNADLKINDWIKTLIDVSGFFEINKGARGNYWGDAAAVRPNEFTPLIPISLINQDNEVLHGSKNNIKGLYLLGGNSNHQSTAFGDVYSGGISNLIERNYSFNDRINMNLSRVTTGLSFHTNISFNYFVRYDQDVINQYAVYEPEWSSDKNSIIGLEKFGKDSRSGIQEVGNTYFRRRFGSYALVNYDRTFNNINHFSGSLLGYFSNFKAQGDFQGVKEAHLGLKLKYIYDEKYMVDFSSALNNSVKLAKGHRGGLSPSVGAAWVISNENFMSSSHIVNYLKLRMTAGILKSDFPISGFYHYDSQYGGSGGYSWDEGSRSRSGTQSDWGSNPNLGYIKRKEASIGLQGSFFNSHIGAQVNGFYDTYNGLIVRPNTQFPNYYSDFIPYENFGSNAYYGLEAELNYNKIFGDWSLFVGANFLYSTSKRTKVNEVHKFKNLYKQGDPATGRYGLIALGLFQSQKAIDSSPTQEFGTVKPGDIKYKDVNGDGKIDDNDIVYLGSYQPPISGGLQFKLSYRMLTLYVLCQGDLGEYEFKNSSYYWINGTDKYSSVVLGSWTPDTKNTATFPRLTSKTGSNNYRNSSYWGYKTNHFTIRRIQIDYQLPQSFSAISGWYLFLDASNAYQFAKNRKIINLNPGGAPSFRTFSIGLRAKL